MRVGLPGADVIRAIILLVAACSTAHTVAIKQDEKLSEVEHARLDANEHEGPWTLTTTTEEFAYADLAGADPDGGVVSDGDERGIPADGETLEETRSGVGRSGAPALLVKRTVAVEQHGARDLSVEARSDGWAGAETVTDLKGSDTMKPAGGCMLGLGFWGAVAIAVVLAAASAYLKLRRPP